MVSRVKCGFGLEPKRMDHPPKTERHRYGAVARGTAVIAATLATLACSAGADEHAERRAQAIANGTADVSHQNVFLLVRESQDSGALCTATLIAPNLLLTARHCVSPSAGDEHVLCGDSVLGDPYPPSAFIATNDAQPSKSSAIFHAVDVRIPGLGQDTCGYDVALITLKENVPSDASTPAVPRIDREVTPGELYTAVGYGLNELGSPTHGRMELQGLSIECEPGSCGDGVESTEFRGETGICSGDSGGPAFDADGKVVGVVSRGGPDCSTPVYSTVTAWHDFIINTATEAAQLGGYDAPFWVTSGLSDPAPVLGQGGAGGASATGELASEGQACDGASACQSDLVCYASGSNASGACAKVCQATSDCGDGQACVDTGSVSVCVLPLASADDKRGCSIAVAASPRSLSSLALAAIGVMLGWARRRRA